MTSSFCTINGSNPPQNVAVGSSVTLQLLDITGVSSWSITCTNSDEQNVPATITAGLSINNTTKTATFTMPSNVTGSSLQFTSIVNAGTATSSTTTFGVFAIGPGGLQLLFTNESFECDANFGIITPINAILRQGGSIGTGSTPHATTVLAGTVILAGDLGGTYNAPKVLGVDGVSIIGGAPTVNQILIAQSSGTMSWQSDASIPISGDVIGTLSAASVVGIQGVAVSSTAPTKGQFLVATGVANWSPASFQEMFHYHQPLEPSCL